MIEEYQLIARKAYLRQKKSYYYSMTQDTKSSVQFKNACENRIKEIEKEIEEINEKILKERTRKYGRQIS